MMDEFVFYYDEHDTLRIFKVKEIEDDITYYTEELDEGISISKLTDTNEVAGITILETSTKDKEKIEKMLPEHFRKEFEHAYETYITTHIS